MTAGPTGKRLVLEVYKATTFVGDPIQVNLKVQDVDGSGVGTRLAGPKFGGAGSKLLRSTELDERARQDIRRALDEVDGRETRKNVPRGLYRNTQGAELRVTGTAMQMNGYNTLAGDIAVAEAADELWPSHQQYLVTEVSLKACGYELIEPEAT